MPIYVSTHDLEWAMKRLPDIGTCKDGTVRVEIAPDTALTGRKELIFTRGYGSSGTPVWMLAVLC